MQMGFAYLDHYAVGFAYVDHCANMYSRAQLTLIVYYANKHIYNPDPLILNVWSWAPNCNDHPTYWFSENNFLG